LAVGFVLLGLYLARIRDLSAADGQRLIDGLKALPSKIETVLALEPAIADAAISVAKAQSCFFIGQVRGYLVAREGAQKLKEISYLHAEAYQTSELKHGPLALICPEVPTVAIIPDDNLLDRNITAVHEIFARSSPIIAITHEGSTSATFPVPRSRFRGPSRSSTPS
jgi:glucosamine--fructose-6-phosphate aminotransferase (isomerizing)